jgi:ribosome-associated protein
VPEPDELRVAPGVAVAAAELNWRFSASGGAGGQHVNTSNTRAEVIWDIAGSPSLPDHLRERLTARLGPVVAVVASDRRSQIRNRELALSRLQARVQAALEERRPRRPTRPTPASRRRRLDDKHRRSGLKRSRRQRAGED